jgi:hypothetical protein
MVRNRLGAGALMFALALLASAPAEAGRIGIRAGDSGLVVWDGSGDVTSMNTDPHDTVLLPFLNASDLFVTVTVVGSPDPFAVQSVHLLATGAENPAYTTILHAVCPAAATVADCPALSGPAGSPFYQYDSALHSVGDPADDAFLETELRAAFGAELQLVGADYKLTTLADQTKFNTLLPLLQNGTLRLGLEIKLADNFITNSFTDAVRFDIQGANSTAAPVPEPASLVLLASGLGMGITRFRARRRAR